MASTIEYLKQFLGDKASDVGAFLIANPGVTDRLTTAASRSTPFGVTGPMVGEAVMSQEPLSSLIRAFRDGKTQVDNEMARQPVAQPAQVQQSSVFEDASRASITGRRTSLDQIEMPVGYTGVGEGGFAEQAAMLPSVSNQAAQSSQTEQSDPLVQAILSILAQKPQPTEATPVRDTAAVVDEFNQRNPRANPENKPGFDKFLDFIGLSRGPAELNPAELLKLQADLGISSEGLAGEQQLNRGMRSTEHAAVVGGQPQARDYLNILAGKSNIQDQANVQSRLQAEQAGLTKDINRANVGNQKEIIGATSAAQTSPRAVRSEIAVRNPEGMTKETFEETIGVPIGSLSNEQWEIIRASNNKAASPMEQVMAMLIAERIGRTGPGRQAQGQVPINTSALTQ